MRPILSCPIVALDVPLLLTMAYHLHHLLSNGVQRHEIPERLKLYNQARHERATTVQKITRDSAHGPLPPPESQAIVNYIYGHDEVDHSTQILRKYLWVKNPRMYWRQPIVFGPMPGLRQDFFLPRSCGEVFEVNLQDSINRFRTSRTLLQNLLPNESFGSPGTTAYASFSQTTLNGMDWLGCCRYRHLGHSIEGVQYKKANGEVVKLTYVPILFENLADPIISGREELGMPKLYTAIDAHERRDSYHRQTSWQGAISGHFHQESLEDVDSQKMTPVLSAENPAMVSSCTVIFPRSVAIAKDRRRLSIQSSYRMQQNPRGTVQGDTSTQND